MAFFNTLGRGLLKGLNFLGQGNPVTGAIGVGGAIASGIAKGGRQSAQDVTGAQTQASTGTSQQTSTGTIEEQQTELPELSPFRQGQMRQLEQAQHEARQPIFGAGQQAAFVNQVNETTNRAFESINQRLATRGAGASGQLRSDTTELELARGAQLSDFFSNLPFREAEARNARLTPLIQAGLSFAGRGPTGTTQTRDLTETGQTASNVQTDSTQSTVNKGPGALGGILGELGDLAAGGIARGAFDKPVERFDDVAIAGAGTPAPGPAQPIGGQAPPVAGVGTPPFRIFPQTSSVRTPLYMSRR